MYKQKQLVELCSSFEQNRLKDLYDLNILDTQREERFDRYTRHAQELFNLPVAIITLIDHERQWFKSCMGADLVETSRDVAFCDITILHNTTLIVPDMSKDDRFCNNPLVVKPPFVRFYAGSVLRGPNKFPIGTLCLIGFKPRQMSKTEQRYLESLTSMLNEEIMHSYNIEVLKKDVHRAIYFDLITDMPNDKLFITRLSQAIETKKSAKQIVVLRLGFKEFIDLSSCFGADWTNSILKQISKRLRTFLRKDHEIAYLNEGCFGIFFNAHLDTISDIDETLNYYLTVFEQPFLLDQNKSEELSGCVGVIFVKTNQETAEQIMINVKQAFNEAQEQSISPKHFYQSEYSSKITYYYRIERFLRKSIERNAVYNVYQPILNIASNKLGSFETLSRWQNLADQDFSVEEIISVAEKTGLIIPYGYHSLRQAIRDYKEVKWFKRDSELTININLSPVQVMSDDLIPQLQKIFVEENFDPQHLIFELTESLLLERKDEAIEKINQLEAMKISLVMDDFGVGYSSLTLLSQLPFKGIKLDKGFIQPMFVEKKNTDLVEAIIVMSRALNLEVCAEGVETLQALDFLKSKGCHKVQGYYYSRPLEKQKFIELIQTQQY